MFNDYFGNYYSDSEESEQESAPTFETFSSVPGPRLRKLGPNTVFDSTPKKEPEQPSTSKNDQDLDDLLKEIDLL